MLFSKAKRKALRDEIIRKRKALSPEESRRAGEAVTAGLLEHPFFSVPRRVASYVSLNGELDTALINKTLLERGHGLALPVIDPKVRGQMKFYSVSDLAELVPNRYKILEPVPSPGTLLIPDLVDAILVPLVGFDLKGNRLGMGGGYYDRMLKKVSASCLIIGIAYEFQKLPKIPVRHWDMPLDEIFTESSRYVITKKL